MSTEIKKVGVLGSGVMGAQIAAHMTNANIPVYCFDMAQDICVKGVDASVKLKPSPFYNPKSVEMITPLNYDKHLEKLSECDWIIEVISERLDWKRDLYDRIAPHISEKCILTSNTSGISLSQLSEKMPDSLKNKFFITHFFNPPRYMKLVEIIANENVDKNLVDKIDIFLSNQLGKGVVHAKDTPNFIANRLGVYGMMVTLEEAKKYKLSIENVDALTGTLIGRPKSATFRTADVVGLDTMAFVAKTAYDNCEDDPDREIFKIPSYLDSMLEQKWLGQKSGQGFYKKIDKGVIHSINLDTMEYGPMNKNRYDAIALAKEKTYLNDKINAIVRSEDVAGEFLWNTISRSLLYSANIGMKISDDIISVDSALKWGFGWELGPFEVLDAIGLDYFVNRLKQEGKKCSDWLVEMNQNGHKSLYKYIDGNKHYYCPFNKDYKPVDVSEKNISLLDFKKKNKIIKKHWSASLIDVGDGVAAIELHSVLQPALNPIDGSMTEMLKFGLDWVADNSYKGLIITGDGNNFCAGANLNLILSASENKNFDAIDDLTNSLQQVFQNMKYSKFPVIAAPYGLVLGGGMEMVGGCDLRVAAAETYIGLVEVGVGLIPGAGGNLRLLSNLSKKIKTGITGTLPLVQKAFETIGFAKVATSAHHAKSYGYFTPEDKIIVNRSHLLFESKKTVLELSKNYVPSEPETFKLPGSAGRMAIEMAAKGMVKSGKISEHDALIGKKLAYVLTGGNKGGPFSPVDEQYLLDIEREAFISLCGEKKSIDRIRFMLKKGKPLRN